MATQQAVGGSAITRTSSRQNSGIMKGGPDSSIAGARMSSIVLGRAVDTTGTGSVDGNHTDKIFSNAAFGYFNKNQFIIRRYSTTVAGITNNVQKSGGTFKLHRSINQYPSVFSTTRKATAIRANYYSPYSGTFSTPPTTASDTFAADGAVTSYSILGELVFLTGKPTPSQLDYAPRFG